MAVIWQLLMDLPKFYHPSIIVNALKYTRTICQKFPFQMCTGRVISPKFYAANISCYTIVTTIKNHEGFLEEICDRICKKGSSTRIHFSEFEEL